MWGADEEAQCARRHQEENSHKENALCGNKKMRNTKIYMHTGGVRRERERERERERAGVRE
jgi:hypothetical protein